MEYLIKVLEHGQMKILEVTDGDARWVEPLGPGVYHFVRIGFPLDCKGDTDWLALKKPYEQSEGVEIVGRSASILADLKRQEEEGFTIEAITVRGDKQERQPTR